MKHTINAIAYVIIFLGIQAAVGLIVKTVWQLVTGSADITTPKMITTTVVFSLLSIAVFLLARWAEVSPTWLRTRPWMTLGWSVVAALGFVIPSIWIQEQLPELPNLIEDEFGQIMADRWGYLAIGLLAPLAEEVVFRGAALRSLLGWAEGRGEWGAWTAIAVSALLFAAAHLNPAQMPHAFIVGLLLGWMYWRTGSILPGMAYHWANNSTAYVIYNLYPNPDIQLIDIFGGSQQRVMMAVGFSLLILLPAIYQLHLWMKRAD